jgi:hypothetical protein
MRLSSPVAILGLLAASTLIARADTIVPFDLNATLQGLGGGAVSGMVNVDITNGMFTAIDFTATIGGVSHIFIDPLTTFRQGPVPTPPTLYVGLFTDSSGDMFQLALPTTSLVGYSGSAVCSLGLSCNPTMDIPTVFIQAKTDIGAVATFGSLTPAPASTPEPSTFALLGTGILGVAGMTCCKLSSHSMR